ncbi:glycosyltransferase [Halopseudomonas nanhaiensis]|uniref:glycosyltransferase n=1 Tax=Halopseudomonas nanhaiensis TaxID=2830842 RepID=UPI001CBACF6E|nr:glycosyltransferase [Halopseudomonas nanhaiensis]
MRRKKLIHVVESVSDTYGGPAKSVPYLIAGLNATGHVNSLVSISSPDGNHNSVCSEHSIEPIIFNGYTKKFRYSPALSRHLIALAKQSDIIHTHNLWTYPAIAAYRAAKVVRAPLVCSIRGNLYEWNLQQSAFAKRAALSLYQHKILASADLLHATEPNEIVAIRRLGISSPIALIPNGINFDEFSQLPSREVASSTLKINPHSKKILFLSRVHPKKGIDILIDTFSRLASRYPDWELLIVGPIADDTNIADIVKRNIAAASRIHVMGMLAGAERQAAFAASDLFVLPTHSENFGIAIGEAMAAGLPVLTTTGTPWTILNEISAGWCVELSPETFQSHLSEAMSTDRKILKKMGDFGRHHVTQNYSWSMVCKMMGASYSWLLDSNLPKPSFIFD